LGNILGDFSQTHLVTLVPILVERNQRACPKLDGTPASALTTRDRCYDFSKNIFAEKFGENIGFFAQTTDSFCKNLIITLVFDRKANFFAKNGKNRRKL
jgi:hypothetical protein